MEDCRFYETMESDLGADYVFEHLFFTRDKKPTFDIELKKRVKKSAEEEEFIPNKKIHKPDDQEVSSQSQTQCNNNNHHEKIKQDLQILMNFEQMLTAQINHRIQLLRTKMSELDSDLQLSK